MNVMSYVIMYDVMVQKKLFIYALKLFIMKRKFQFLS